MNDHAIDPAAEAADQEDRATFTCPSCGKKTEFVLQCRNLECDKAGCPRCFEFDGKTWTDYFCSKDCISKLDIHTMLMSILNHGSKDLSGIVMIIQETLNKILNREGEKIEA